MGETVVENFTGVALIIKTSGIDNFAFRNDMSMLELTGSMGYDAPPLTQQLDNTADKVLANSDVAVALLSNGELSLLSSNPYDNILLHRYGEMYDLKDIALDRYVMGLRNDGTVVGMCFSDLGGAFDLTKGAQ